MDKSTKFVDVCQATGVTVWRNHWAKQFIHNNFKMAEGSKQQIYNEETAPSFLVYM